MLPGLNADPNIVRFGDTYYIYPTTDGFAGWSGTKFKACSSKDLVHWTDHGVILDLGPDVSLGGQPAPGRRRWPRRTASTTSTSAPTRTSASRSSDSPTGPFTDALGKPLVAGPTTRGQMIDPAVFTDDDGQSLPLLGQRHGVRRAAERRHDLVRRQQGSSDITGLDRLPRGPVRDQAQRHLLLQWSVDDTRQRELPRRLRHRRPARPGPLDQQGRDPGEGPVPRHPGHRPPLGHPGAGHRRLVHRLPPVRHPRRRRHAPRDHHRPAASSTPTARSRRSSRRWRASTRSTYTGVAPQAAVSTPAPTAGTARVRS